MKLTAKITGLDKIAAEIGFVTGALRRALRLELNRIADEIIAEQRRLAPTRTGKGAAEIHKVAGTGTGPLLSVHKPQTAEFLPLEDQGELIGWKGSNLDIKIVAAEGDSFYMSFAEFGTAHEAPHPFFYGPFRVMKSRIPDRLRAALERVLNRTDELVAAYEDIAAMVEGDG